MDKFQELVYNIKHYAKFDVPMIVGVIGPIDFAEKLKDALPFTALVLDTKEIEDLTDPNKPMRVFIWVFKRASDVTDSWLHKCRIKVIVQDDGEFEFIDDKTVRAKAKFEEDMADQVVDTIQERWALVEKALTMTANIGMEKSLKGTYHNKFYPLSDDMVAAIEACRAACDAMGLKYDKK